MFEQWVGMEQFYYNDMWYYVISSCILGIFFFPALKYYKSIAAKVIIVVTIIVWILTFRFVGSGYAQYGDLIPLTSYSNPATRYVEKKLFNDFSYGYSDYSYYRVAYMKDYFEKIQVYHPIELRDDIEYLGTDGQYYFFNYGNDQVYYCGKRFVSFKDNIDAPERVGVKYELNDPRFEEIHFVPDSANFFLKYEVPSNLKDKRVNQDIKNIARYQAQTMIKNWIVP